MAKFELRLSAKLTKAGRQEILMRFHDRRNIDLRAKTGIFVCKNYFLHYINTKACVENNIPLPRRGMLISRQTAQDKGIIIYEKGELVIRRRRVTEETLYHRLQKSRLDQLMLNIVNSFDLLKHSEQKRLTSSWLQVLIDNYIKTGQPIVTDSRMRLPATLCEVIDYFKKKTKSRIIETGRFNSGKTLSSKTLIQHNQTHNRLREYLRDRHLNDIPFERIDKNFYDDLICYFMERNMAKNTIGKHIKNIKAMLKTLPAPMILNCEFVTKGKCVKLEEDINNIALTESDLERLRRCRLSGILERVRDQFLLLCWTGCRYSDLDKLNILNIKNLGSGRVFKFRQQKTGNSVTIPIMEDIVPVLEKYNYDLGESLPNHLFNRYLKQVCRYAGFDQIVSIERTEGGRHNIHYRAKWQVVTAHTARRTFATNMYRRGYPTLAIMKLTGHSSERSFLKYIKVDNDQNALLIMDFAKSRSSLLPVPARQYPQFHIDLPWHLASAAPTYRGTI